MIRNIKWVYVAGNVTTIIGCAFYGACLAWGAASDPLAPAPLRWHDPADPKPRDGYYWIRSQPAGVAPMIVRLDRDGNPGVAAEWAGPIPEPRERGR